MHLLSVPPSTDTAPLRRNGRQQACEPCRKRKVACDHKMPVCSRCRYGKISSKCVYSAGTTIVASKRRSRSSTTSLRPGPLERSTSNSSPEPLIPPTHKEGYLGATSYRFAMREAQSMMPPAAAAPLEDLSVDSNMSDPSFSRSRLTRDVKTYGAAMRVLRTVPRKDLSYELFKAHVNPNDGWCRLATQWLHDAFWDSFGAYFEDDDRSEDSLFDLAMILCRNSSKTLREDYTDPKEWFGSFSGRNMRWEGLGLLFTHWSLGAIALRHGAESSKYTFHDYSSYILKYKDCASDTIEIARNTLSANTILLYLMYRQGCLESLITGDDSLQHSMFHCETMGLMTYLGLHATGGALQDRGICIQIKRRLFGKIFHGDKVVSTFTGRPPMLSRRFVSTLLPLDVSDEVLLGVTPWRDDIVDEAGWNTLGEIYASTLLRARTYMGFIRDSILNDTLQNSDSMSREELLKLRRNQEDIMAKFPQWLIFNPKDVSDLDISGPKLYAKLLIKLEYLQNVFFIERLLNKVDNATLSARLLQVSLEIVSLTLIFWTHKDRLTGLREDFEWLVIGFASPAAGILCLELLQPSAAAGSPATPRVSRSEVIQNLSLLNGFLSWIKPLVPSRELTCCVWRVIQRVLDQTLNTPASSTAEPILDMMEWGAEMGIDTNDFNFELLNTFDWMRPDTEV